MQSRGICRTVSQLCTRWPHKMAKSLHTSYACPLYPAFQLGEGSPACVKFPQCPLAVLPMGQSAAPTPAPDTEELSANSTK